ncbi:hypothetical protein BC629DRAFT_1081402 [Irpex lacteus]|nr:hypothetical protein BC629DRAFT_1081402 [Irpex lacteus]
MLAGDFMTYMYHDAGFNEENIEEGLFRGPLLLAVVRHIFTGPSSALNKLPGPSSVGRPSIAVVLNQKEVIPEMIAWAAVMCYFALCRLNSWDLQDGGVNLLSLWDAVIGTFEDRESKWAVQTLQWYNLNVFGPQAVKSNAQHQQTVRETMAQKLARQRIEREAAEAAARESPGPA